MNRTESSKPGWKSLKAQRFLLPLFLFQVTFAQVPRIVSFVPTGGRVGDTIQVSGQNFSPIGNQNIVRFGAARAGVVIPNSIQPDRGFRAVVPRGATYDRLSVTTNGLTAYSQLWFVPRFPGSDSITFSSPSVFVGPSRNVVLADVNNDNKVDLASVGWRSIGNDHALHIHTNTTTTPGSAITFDPLADYGPPYAGNLNSIVRGDFDSDGRLDIAILGELTGFFDTLLVYRNTGTTPQFASPVPIYVPGTERYGMAVADMNADGKPDIVIADRGNRTNGFIRILTNTSVGSAISFSVSSINTTRCPWDIVVADFNGDEYPEIAWPENRNGNAVDTVAVLKNNGGGNYGPLTEVKVDLPYVSAVEVGDFDNDSRNDLAFIHDNGNVSVLQNITSQGIGADPSFTKVLSLSLGNNLRDPNVADINGDGKLDLVIPSTVNGGSMLVLKNTSSGNGNFSFTNVNPSGFPTQGVYASVSGDLNSDGKPDIVTAGGYASTSTMSYLRNTTGPPPATNFVKVSGDNQSNPILTSLPDPFIVRVTDPGGTPVPGYAVNFSITQSPDSGSLSTTSTITDANGEGRTTLTLGSHTGTYVVQSNASGLTGSPQSFTATATVGSASTIETISGDAQTRQILTQLPDPFVVKITDAGGNPVQGYTITFGITGFPSGAIGQSLSVTSMPTDANGLAQTYLTLGNRVGSYQVTATAGSLVGSPRQFEATATVGQATTLSAFSGNLQTGQILTQLANPFVVRVVDQGGNPVFGFPVNFVIASRPANATGDTLSIVSTNTDSNGRAQTSLTLGNKVGEYQVNGTGSGLSGSPQLFTATASTGSANAMTILSGNLQNGPIADTLANPFVVFVEDVGGNPVSGVTVNFAIDSIPSGAVGQGLTSTSGNTNSSGHAQTFLIMGNLVGQYRVKATASVPNGPVQSFLATAVLAGAPRLSTISGNNQTREILTVLDSLVVEIRDSANNPVANRIVNFSIVSTPGGAAGQSLTDTVVMTNIAGRAASRFQLGNKVGLYAVQARSTGAINSPQMFSSTATPGSAKALLTISGTGQPPQPAGTLLQPFVVQVQDTGQNAVPNFNVRFQLVANPGGGTPTDTTVLTDTAGAARVRLRLGLTPGVYQMNATAAVSTGSPQQFSASATAGAARSLQNISGASQSGQVLSQLANPFIVRVVDSTGNPISGFNVTFAIQQRPANATGDTLSNTNVSTGADGMAQTFLRLGNKVGAYTISATAPGLTGSPQQFVATATAGAPTLMQIVSGNNQTGRVLTPLSEPFLIQISDSSGNSISGLAATFMITNRPTGAAGDSLINVSSPTDSSGRAHATLRLGDKIGEYQVNVSAGSITPRQFIAMATVGIAKSIQMSSGNNQSGQILSILSNPLVVRVTDTTGNPVSGFAVGFSITGKPAGATNDTLLISSPTTDANGLAQTYIRLGNLTGAYEVTATALGLTGSPLLFTATATPVAATASVTTNVADTITFSGATLHGTINPASQSGIGYFEWGTSSVLANPTRTSPTVVPASASAIPVRQLLTGLSPNFTFYYRTVGEIGGQTLTGGIMSFTTLNNSTTASGSVDFPPNPTSDTYYKLVSLPGTNAGTVNDLIQGSGPRQEFDWRVYRDNGANSTYPAYLQEMGATEPVRIGEGYWLLRKNTLSIVQRPVSLPTLRPDGTALIDLHAGWNIIANPFNASVPWAAVVQANGITNSVLNGYEGGYRNETALQPFRGDYFDNRTASLDSLKIPYPFTNSNPTVVDGPPMQWKVKIEFSAGINDDGENYIGIASSSRAGYDPLELRKPPLFGDLGYLYFERREWDNEFSNFSTDIRPDVGEGQTWEFDVSNPRGGLSSLRFAGISQVPGANEVMLINENNSTPFDLRKDSLYAYQTIAPVMKFTLVIGTKEFIQQQHSASVPKEFTLRQNYPNPFNPTTTISFGLPRESDVQLEAYSILGQKVKTLAHARMAAAFYSVLWDGKSDNGISVASGVYFYRLVADGQIIQTRKMIFAK